MSMSELIDKAGRSAPRRVSGTMDGNKPDGACCPVRNVLRWVSVTVLLRHRGNVRSGVANPAPLREQCRARLWSAFDAEPCRDAKKALQPRDVKKREAFTVRDLSHEALKRAAYFVHQAHWLLSRFPDGAYQDIGGLCKLVSRAEIAANDYSLTPGRYVGVAVVLDEEDDEAFVTRMMEIHGELNELNDKAAQLAERIGRNFEELLA